MVDYPCSSPNKNKSLVEQFIEKFAFMETKRYICDRNRDMT